MNNPVNYLASMLQCFLDEFYSEGVRNLRRDLDQNASFRDAWPIIVRLILNKELKEGQALDLVHNTANLPLYENTDEEAYRWLNLMLVNAAGQEDDPILDYKEVFRPKEDLDKLTPR